MKLPAAVRRCAIYIANAADPRRHGGEMSLWLRMPYRRGDIRRRPVSRHTGEVRCPGQVRPWASQT